MASAKLWVLIVFMLAGGILAQAQTNVNEEQGLKPYDSWHGGDLDSISMTNGALTLHIPLLSYPQRGNLDLSFTAYSNTKQWVLVPTCFNDPINGGQLAIGIGSRCQGAVNYKNTVSPPSMESTSPAASIIGCRTPAMQNPLIQMEAQPLMIGLTPSSGPTAMRIVLEMA